MVEEVEGHFHRLFELDLGVNMEKNEQKNFNSKQYICRDSPLWHVSAISMYLDLTECLDQFHFGLPSETKQKHYYAMN